MTEEVVAGRVRSADGTLIAYEVTGAGPAVILVDAAGCYRGLGPSASLGRRLAADFRVLTYDRRGRGESTNTMPYAVTREVEDIAALIEAVGGSASLYGYSSGAVLALHAAASGLAVRRLVLNEPPLDVVGEPPPVSSLEIEVADLVAAGRPGDAVEHFQRSIGMPDEYLEGIREAPYWPALERLAPTLVYDLAITRTLPADRLTSVTVPTLVVECDASSSDLRGWAHAVTDTLPEAWLRTLPGEWHGVLEADLARELRSFLGDGALPYSRP
jgi:pimeloyl-ACP methyl ester carboxylesterase